MQPKLYWEETMKNLQMEDLVEKSESTSDEAQVETKETVETETKVETEQDPLKTELTKVQERQGRSEKDKAEFSLKKNAERFKELGGDPNEVLGIKTEESTDDENTPVTLGMLKKLQRESASKTALQEAEEIQNETERELVKFHLQNTIRSTGVPAEDLKLARALVNSVKNSQIIQETARKTSPKTHSSSSGVDAKHEETIVYTPEELAFMKPPFNATPADVLNARKGIQMKFK